MILEEFVKTGRFSRELQAAKNRREKYRKISRVYTTVFVCIAVIFVGVTIASLILDDESDTFEIVNAVTVLIYTCGTSLASFFASSYRDVEFNCGLCVKEELAESSVCLAETLSSDDWADFYENGLMDVKICYTKNANASKKEYPYCNSVALKGKTREFSFDLSCFEGLLGTGAFAGALCMGLIPYLESREMRGDRFSEAKLSVIIDGNDPKIFFPLIKKGKRTSSWRQICKQSEKARQAIEQRKYS